MLLLMVRVPVSTLMLGLPPWKTMGKELLMVLPPASSRRLPPAITLPRTVRETPPVPETVLPEPVNLSSSTTRPAMLSTEETLLEKTTMVPPDSPLVGFPLVQLKKLSQLPPADGPIHWCVAGFNRSSSLSIPSRAVIGRRAARRCRRATPLAS